MKNLFKCSTLIRAVVIMIVMAFMVTQVTDTESGNKQNKNNHNNGTSGGGSSNNGGGINNTNDILGEIVEILSAILSKLEECCPGGGNGNGGNGGTGDPDCICDEDGLITVDANWSIRNPDDPITEACDFTRGNAWQREQAPGLTWLESALYCSDLGPGWGLPSTDQVTSLLPLNTSVIPDPTAGNDDIWTNEAGGAGVHIAVRPATGAAFPEDDDTETNVAWCVKPCPQ